MSKVVVRRWAQGQRAWCYYVQGDIMWTWQIAKATRFEVEDGIARVLALYEKDHKLSLEEVDE